MFIQPHDFRINSVIANTNIDRKGLKIIKIFLASSFELKKDRDAIEKFVGAENKHLRKYDVALELEQWEYASETISGTRKQDDYNSLVKGSDIALCLFHTKVGKYTREEFEVAYENFLANGRPKVYTYFSQEGVDFTRISRQDTEGYHDFKDRLVEIEHFPSHYKTSEDLLFQFKRQLENYFGELGPLERVDRANKPSETKRKPPVALSLQLPVVNEADIIGRENDLEELKTLLFNKHRAVVVNGMGGIGKTTLAQAYLHKYGHLYRHHLWTNSTGDHFEIDLISTEGLKDGLSMADSEGDQKALFGLMIQKLRALPGPNLLIIDNANNSLSNYHDVLPQQGNWHILVTSREEINRFHLKRLDFLTEEDAVGLFQKHCKRHFELGSILSLVRAVEYHTLTVEILAKTANKPSFGYEDLLGALTKNERSGVFTNHSNGQIARIQSYIGSMFKLQKLSYEEIVVLKNLVMMPFTFISFRRLQDLIKLPEKEPFPMTFDNALSELCSKGWVLWNPETNQYKVHVIIATAVQANQKIFIEEIMFMVGRIYAELNYWEKKVEPEDVFEWLPFGVSIAMKVSWLKTLDTKANRIIRIARVLNIVGVLVKIYGNYRLAKFCSEFAVAAMEDILPPDHWELSETRSNLACLLMELDELDKAKELIEFTIEFDKKNRGEKSHQLAIGYSILGIILGRQEKYEEAKKYDELALKIDLENFSENHRIIETRYCNLAVALSKVGDFERAHELSEKAIELAENRSSQSLSLCTNYANHGLLLMELERLDDALAFVSKSLKMKQDILGRVPHHRCAIDYHSIGRIHFKKGDLDLALENYKIAQEMYKLCLPQNHSDIVRLNKHIEEANSVVGTG